MACFSSLLVCVNIAPIATSIMYQNCNLTELKTNYMESKGQLLENISVPV